MSDVTSGPLRRAADTAFDGRILQVMDALDVGDAVSAQALALDEMLRHAGYRTSIHTQWFHPAVADRREDLAAAAPGEADVVIYHCSGHSEHAWPAVAALRCTRVCVYHNITPAHYFDAVSSLHRHCTKGREQLAEVVAACHFHWGDSHYNLRELAEKGADQRSMACVPIQVKAPLDVPTLPREPGSWLFVGRIAGNKAQLRLVGLFAQMRIRHPACATRLDLVGGADETDPYPGRVAREIDRLGLADCVRLHGKVDDAALAHHFARADVFVSMSEHEGFGVPLVEAALRGLPALALRGTAVDETLGDGGGLADSPDALLTEIARVITDPSHRQALLSAQQVNARRFDREAIEGHLRAALQGVLPGHGRFRTVSIVVCTCDRADHLERCLDYLRDQWSTAFEVVVVDGPSTDRTVEVLTAHASRIKVGRNPERNLSVSRNIGIELASGDLIAFIDDDALPFDDWVHTLLEEFNRRPLTLAGLGGPVYYAGTFDWQVEQIGINRFGETDSALSADRLGRDGWVRTLLGTNACFRADLLREAGGFDEQFDYFLDESELCYRLQRAGHLVGYSPALVLRHEFARSHHRAGRLDFAWFTICKNTAYFAAAYAGLDDRRLRRYLSQRMQDERIAPLDRALHEGRIDPESHCRYVSDIHRGVEQGLLDARRFPRTRALGQRGGRLLAYAGSAAVGRSTVPRRLHVCILTREFPPFTGSGGIGTLYYHLASELLMMGHRLTVILPGSSSKTLRRGRFEVRWVPTRSVCTGLTDAPAFVANLDRAVGALAELARLHGEEPVDVVDSASWDAEALALALLPRGRRPPVVVRLVTPVQVVARLNGWDLPGPTLALMDEAERSVVRAAEAVVPISNAVATTFEEGLGLAPDARWERSPCGIAHWPFFDVARDYERIGPADGPALGWVGGSGIRMLLFVGRLEGRKGVGELFRAAPDILDGDAHVHLVIAGRDVDGAGARWLAALPEPLRERVHLLGEVDDALRDKLLHAAYGLVFPSHYESFGLVPLEAFVHGVPVVAARAGGIPEVVVDEDCGLLFEPGDATGLARCVSRLLREPGLRDRLSAGARRRLRAFGAREAARRAASVYERLATARGLSASR